MVSKVNQFEVGLGCQRAEIRQQVVEQVLVDWLAGYQVGSKRR